MQLMHAGIAQMADWVADRRPSCMPEGWDPQSSTLDKTIDLFPHEGYEGGRCLSGNEMLAELAGRKCYNSFGERAGKKTNSEYIQNTQGGDIPHASILYHCKMSFFVAGVSRRVSHELIRHYVGADRTEEGAPSQESTRYVEHVGTYVAHPRILSIPNELIEFTNEMSYNLDTYSRYITRQIAKHVEQTGSEPKGMDRKRIYESASSYLSHACETSFIWTTNPIALAKLIKERDNEGSDLEFQRLARVWKGVAKRHWPNLFCQPWMVSKMAKQNPGEQPPMVSGAGQVS